MLIPSDADFDLAVRKLETAGFRQTPWSYATVDPQRLEGDEELQRIHQAAIPKYIMLDNNSVRFQFPRSKLYHTKVVLLRSAYVEMQPPTNPTSMRRFTCRKHVYYPDKTLLLESFIKTLLKTPMGTWRSSLTTWAICYVYSMLGIEDSALDFCGDEKVIEWFNENIRRSTGGIDRTTVTKRFGRA